ncbi:uncharacterized protein LOC115217489 [Octopus sinensis]|uniref:Uncharacterized protein LOC115217489 n=1 Tax=Octopus sinensis TaxID=2607531 RepID=A0A6P7SXI6_9MOLL|nr:uncharacterized protein LOC115217489 [Octopus sinensis]
MKSEYERQFSPVDPEICEIIYEANKLFRTLRRKHEYEHTPLGINNYKNNMQDGEESGQQLPFLKKLMRRSNSTERLTYTGYYHTKKHPRRSKSADRSLMYQKYDRKVAEEPKLTRTSAKTESQEKTNSGKPKIRIKLPPFVAYGSGCSGREMGDLKTHNVNATSQPSKNVIQPALLNGVIRADRLKPTETANRARSPSPLTDMERSHHSDTGTWLSKETAPDWKTEYSSNFCS